MPLNNREHLPALVTGCGLVLLWVLESWLPEAAGRRHRLRHASRNLMLGLLNAVPIALLAAPFVTQVAGWAEESRFGLLRLLNLPPLMATAAAILLFDGWMYLWHRANHQFPFLWRFHRVHHSDQEMDATTAIRFHIGEILLSSGLRLIVIPLLGVTLPQLLLYETLLLPVILFHHSNVNFPERLDRWLRILLVSPAIHRVHHSRVRVETDSNYSSVFSFWDRLASSFRLRPDAADIQFGLEGEDDKRQRLAWLLLRPFISSKLSSSTSSPAIPLSRSSPVNK